MTATAWMTLLLLVVSIALSQWRLLDKRQRARSGSDWTTFDKKPFLVTRVADGDTITVRSPAGDTPVRLLGVDAPELNREGQSHPDYWADRAAAYVRGRAEGKFVTLQLDRAADARQVRPPARLRLPLRHRLPQRRPDPRRPGLRRPALQAHVQAAVRAGRKRGAEEAARAVEGRDGRADAAVAARVAQVTAGTTVRRDPRAARRGGEA